MTGEMGRIDQNGLDSNGDRWELHAAIAKAVKGELRPFDVYQGPYIRTPEGSLWVCPDDTWPEYECFIYNDGTDTKSDSFPYECTDIGIEYARDLLRRPTP